MGRQKQQPLEHRLLLTATFCLLAGGAVMVYSASSARTLLQGQGDGTALPAQVRRLRGASGLVGMYLVSRLNLELVRRYTGALLIASFVMLVMVKVPGVGVKVNGAHRWLGFGPLQFQPSEIMKIALVLHIAAVIARRPKIARSIRTLAGPVIGVAGAAVLLIATAARPRHRPRDLRDGRRDDRRRGAADAPARPRGGVGATLVMLFAIFEPYRRARLTSFLDPWDHASGAGFQAVQGQIAIGSRRACSATGWARRSRRSSTFPRPTPTSSSPSSARSSAWRGSWRCCRCTASSGTPGCGPPATPRAPTRSSLAGGLTSLILCQATLNVYAVLGLAPLTGVPLPFISSGSTLADRAAGRDGAAAQRRRRRLDAPASRSRRPKDERERAAAGS